MAWFSPKAPWKSVRKDDKVEIVEKQTGPNSFRFEAVKKEGGYKSPVLVEPYRAVKQPKKARKSYWDSYKNVKFDDEDYYPDTTFRSGSRYNELSSLSTRKFNPTRRENSFKQDEKKEYAWSATRWSSFSFSSFQQDTDSNENLFVREPDGYLTPSKAEIQAKIHIYSVEAINSVKELSRLFYFKMLDNDDYITKDIINIIGETTYDKKKEMYRSAYDIYVPGFTPLEQACNYYQAYLDKQAAANRKDDQSGSGSEHVSFKREDFTDPAINRQVVLNPISNQLKINIINKISLLGRLGQEFDVNKEVGETIVANSDVYKKRIMRDYAQIDRVDLYQKLLPTFDIKFLTKDLVIDVPIETNEKKQKIIILLDYSGSMNETHKQIWVNAILIDRLRYVIRGEAEVFFSYFVSSVSGLQFKHLKNATDVDKFWRSFSNRPSGGTTDIARMVRYIAQEVAEGKKLHNLQNLDLSREKPEILIINDGQDSVNSDAFPYKVNAISLVQFSDELKKLCLATGGKQVRVDGYDDVICYSTEKGEEKFEL